MPRTYSRQLGSRRYADYTEEKLQKCLSDIALGMSQRVAAKTYNIPRSTIKNKIKGKHVKRHGGTRIFTDEEEGIFTRYCILMSSYGFPIDTFDLRCIVKSFLDRQGRRVPKFKNNTPGADWMASFLKRQPDISVRFASNIKRRRAEVGHVALGEYFDNLSVALDGIPPTNIWNYDETNLTDDPGAKRIITKRGCKYPERIINSTKSATSLMFCGNGMGEMLPPYVVYRAEAMWNTWTESGPPGARYNRSKSGWFDCCSFEDWFLSLLLPRLKKDEGRKVIMGDNLSSHISVKVLEACSDNNITFIALPPNSTHLTQPLDVAYFAPMKAAWRKILTAWKQTSKGCKAPCLPKDEFPKLLNQLMNQLQQNGSENLKSGFRKTGIHPLNRDEVFGRLPAAQEPNTSMLSESISESFIAHLNKARGVDDADAARRKRQRVSVVPGKSISADEVRVEAANKAAKKKTSVLPVPVPVPVADVAEACVSVNEAPSTSAATTDAPVAMDQNGDNSSISSHDEGNCHQSESSSNCDEDIVAPRSARKGTSVKEMDYVIVKYDDDYYPGVVVIAKKNGAEVSVMARAGTNWKWPKRIDQIFYFAADIIETINKPVEFGKRSVFRVAEMDYYM